MRGLQLKGEIVRRRLHIYRVASAVRMNPGRFSALLNEHEPLDDETAERILAAIDKMRQRQQPA